MSLCAFCNTEVFHFRPWYLTSLWLPWWLSGEESTCQCRRHGFDQVKKMPWRREWQPTPVFLPRGVLGQRGLVGYSPWGRRKSGTTY